MQGISVLLLSKLFASTWRVVFEARSKVWMMCSIQGQLGSSPLGLCVLCIICHRGVFLYSQYSTTSCFCSYGFLIELPGLQCTEFR